MYDNFIDFKLKGSREEIEDKLLWFFASVEAKKDWRLRSSEASINMSRVHEPAVQYLLVAYNVLVKFWKDQGDQFTQLWSQLSKAERRKFVEPLFPSDQQQKAERLGGAAKLIKDFDDDMRQSLHKGGPSEHLNQMPFSPSLNILKDLFRRSTTKPSKHPPNLKKRSKSSDSIPFAFLKRLCKSPTAAKLFFGLPKTRPSANDVMNEVSKAMGLDDYGENVEYLEGNVEALLIDLFDGIKKGMISRFGCWAQYEHDIKHVLRKRLLVVDYLKTHPEAESLELPQPIFIMGAWRTGTTALHAYLDLDPESRAFKTWEIRAGILSPKIIASTNKKHLCKPGKDPRYIQIKQDIEFVDFLYPKFKPIHHAKVNDPEECDWAFLDLNFGVYSYVVPHLFPTFRKHQQTSADPESTYRWYKRALQALEHQRLTIQNVGVEPTSLPYTYTIFKLPAHSMNMDTILRVFPGAKFVWPHRDFRKAVPSFGKLALLVHSIFAAQERSLVAEGKQKYEFLADEVPNWMKERERLFGAGAEYEGRMADLHYVEFVKNPVEAMRQLYSDLGLEFTPALAEAIMARKKADTETRRKGKAKPHSYTAEEFGLTENMMVEAFGAYEKA
ncbi:hypothetical protein HDV05_005915, partial [Chytridiales sp. JEL 0842]